MHIKLKQSVKCLEGSTLIKINYILLDILPEGPSVQCELPPKYGIIKLIKTLPHDTQDTLNDIIKDKCPEYFI